MGNCPDASSEDQVLAAARRDRTVQGGLGLLDQLLAARRPTLLWEVPIVPRADYPPALQQVYERALLVDGRKTRTANEFIASRLAKGKVLEVLCPNGTHLKAEIAGAIIGQEEPGLLTSENPVLQVVSGETWVLPRVGSPAGCIVPDRRSHALRCAFRMEVQAGRLVSLLNASPTLAAAFLQAVGGIGAPLCEIGFGSNPAVSPGNFLFGGEKAWGTVHFGFGGNHQMGGTITSPHHFDLVVTSPTALIDGRKVMERGEFLC